MRGSRTVEIVMVVEDGGKEQTLKLLQKNIKVPSGKAFLVRAPE
jgi:hypothetical protein